MGTKMALAYAWIFMLSLEEPLPNYPTPQAPPIPKID